jgi:hypothetical protein
MSRQFSVYYADKFPPIHSRFVGDDDWIASAFLNTDFYTRITVLHEGAVCDMYVTLGKGQPRNRRATEVLRQHLIGAVGGLDPEVAPAIHGKAVLIHRADEI